MELLGYRVCICSALIDTAKAILLKEKRTFNGTFFGHHTVFISVR